ncbi:MAG: ASKHA domain-containing protein [Opitutaceae bacterium]
MPHVHFTLQNVSIEVPARRSLLTAIKHAGLRFDLPCDGAGTCGKCRVKLPAVSRAAAVESAHDKLTQADRDAGWALACQTFVHGDVHVEVPLKKDEGLKILRDGQTVAVEIEPWFEKSFDPVSHRTAVLAGGMIVASESGDTTAALYGAAIDIGTTTMVVALVDLRDGRELAHASALNPQARHAQDVLSRIKLGSKPEGLRALHTEVIDELNRLLAEAATEAQVPRERIYEAVFSGNTTMLHLATGTDPASLGKYPYIPQLRGGDSVPAAAIGLELAPGGQVYLPPVMSAYVGADITSGLLATDLAAQKGVTLFVDIGTNGEMVLAADGKLVATSTAAGPAFEGMNIACGMRAGRGAIEFVSLAGDAVELRTIGETTPTGICGSGLLDAVAEFAAHGAVDKNGRFRTNGSAPDRPWKDRLGSLDGKPVFRLTEAVHLSQKDIRQVQLAKAAVRTGIEFLLAAVGRTAAQVDRVLIAGSFGFHLRTASLIHLGLLPREFADRVEFVGNTSKTGARAFLLNRHTREHLRRTVADVQVLELANDASFQRTFVDALAF